MEGLRSRKYFLDLKKSPHKSENSRWKRGVLTLKFKVLIGQVEFEFIAKILTPETLKDSVKISIT